MMKRGVVRREAGEHFDDRVEDQVDHQRQAAAVAVGHQAEEERADRTEGQRGGDGEGHLGVGLVKLAADRRQAGDDEEEVEGVERPAEIAGEQRGAVVRGWVVVMIRERSPEDRQEGPSDAGKQDRDERPEMDGTGVAVEFGERAAQSQHPKDDGVSEIVIARETETDCRGGGERQQRHR